MSLYEAFETDIQLEEEGVWVSLTSDMEAKVCALGNPQHQKVLEKLFKPYRNQIRKNTLDKELEEDIHVQAIARTILTDWRGEGWVDREGKPLPYSYENAYALLSDPKLKRLKADILFLSKEAETFKQEEKEESTKNSKKSSAGSSSTGTSS